MVVSVRWSGDVSRPSTATATLRSWRGKPRALFVPPAESKPEKVERLLEQYLSRPAIAATGVEEAAFPSVGELEHDICPVLSRVASVDDGAAISLSRPKSDGTDTLA